MRPKLALDANLAVLFFVGMTNRDYIAIHKRLTSFDAEAFDLLYGLVASSAGLVFTPNVLSETSNLIRYVRNPIRAEISAVFSCWVSREEEQFIASVTAVARKEHGWLGLTDSVLLELSAAKVRVLTTDLDLFLAAQQADLPVFNFNHLLDQQPGYQPW